ncbi:MAG: PIN domain-containing protein [Verrucomicrobia bacterium]|nr:PIN domain-containing protein [Verrucomicrobiota bacterium]
MLLALEFVELLRGLEGVKILAPGEKHWAIFASLCRASDARGNLVPDAYHAALAIETGCEWVTLNPSSKVEQSDLTQPIDRKEVLSILACINRYALEISATPIGHHLTPTHLFHLRSSG